MSRSTLAPQSKLAGMADFSHQRPMLGNPVGAAGPVKPTGKSAGAPAYMGAPASAQPQAVPMAAPTQASAVQQQMVNRLRGGPRRLS